MRFLNTSSLPAAVLFLAATAANCLPSNNATSLINAAIDGLGGREALTGLQGVTYQSDQIVRVRTLMQNYGLFATDRYTVSAGTQKVSFSFESDELLHRIDRTLRPSDLYFFASPDIAPRSSSIVTKGGSNGYACFLKGNNLIYLPPSFTTGYADPILTDYLVFEALKLSPKLLLEVERHNPIATTVTIHQSTFPAVRDDIFNITVVFDPKTSLPYLVRSIEDHPIFGLTTKDLQLYDYVEVDNLWFPRNQKIVYGDEALLEETIISAITVNPPFEENHFDGLSTNETDTTPSPPEDIPGYGRALVGEYWSAAIWSGPYSGTLANASSTTLAADLPGAYHLVFLDNPNFGQIILEFEESVIVFESPPHQSDLVIRWVKENIGKPISHLYVSHHHHDHNLAVGKFVEIGASIIVPEISASYWRQIPNIDLTTFTETEPYIHSDGKMQVRFLWKPDNPHSVDHTYAMVTTACPGTNSSTIAYTADGFQLELLTDPGVTQSWLLQALSDGLSRNTTVVPVHGQPFPFTTAIEYVAFPYPNYDSTSFVTGGQICLEGQ